MSVIFTTEDILAAVATLRANRVPPAKCTACGHECYLLRPSGVDLPDGWLCECGHRNACEGGFLPIYE